MINQEDNSTSRGELVLGEKNRPEFVMSQSQEPQLGLSILSPSSILREN